MERGGKSGRDSHVARYIINERAPKFERLDTLKICEGVHRAPMVLYTFAKFAAALAEAALRKRDKYLKLFVRMEKASTFENLSSFFRKAEKLQLLLRKAC